MWCSPHHNDRIITLQVCFLIFVPSNAAQAQVCVGLHEKLNRVSGCSKLPYTFLRCVILSKVIKGHAKIHSHGTMRRACTSAQQPTNMGDDTAQPD